MHATGVAKRGKTRASEARLVLVFASHWLRKWREVFVTNDSVVKQNQSKREITFDTQLKTAQTSYIITA